MWRSPKSRPTTTLSDSTPTKPEGVPHVPHGCIDQAGRRRAGLAAAFLTILAIAFTVAVQREAFAWLDQSVRQWLTTVRTDGGIALMLAISRMSSEQVTPFVVLGIGWLIARRDRAWGKYVVLVTLTSTLWHVGLKPVLDRVRPQPPLVPDWTGPSYPSGHALSTLCLVLAIGWWMSCRSGLTPRARTASRLLLVTWAGLVAFSRLYIDAHWLTDVLAGLAIGAAHFLFSVSICGPRLMGPSSD